nr:hypothetical protein [Nanoarchaeum sp.]
MKAPHEKGNKTKIIIALIPVIMLLLLVANNFLIDRTFTKFYDIGNNDKYLTPLNRISESTEEYRNLTAQLVYFDVTLPTGTESITVQTRLQPSLPNNSIISMGAQDQDVWHYKYKPIFNPKLQSEESPINYTKAVEDNGWYITTTAFNIKQDNLTIVNNKLSLLFNVPHLSKNETLNYTIPVDYIKITIYKPGIL